MKSYLVKLLACLTVCSMILLSFAGCISTPDAPTNDTSTPTTDPVPEKETSFEEKSEIQKALYLLDLDETNLPDVDSLTMDATISVSGASSGYATQAEADYRITYHGMQTGDNFSYVESMTMNMNIGNGVYRMTEIAEKGYANGNMFTYSFDSESNTPIGRYSPLSADEYKEHKRTLVSDFDFEITQKNCATISCKKGSDGGYTASFKDFTAAGIAEFDDLLTAFKQIFLSDVTDLVFTVSVDKNLLPTGMTMTFEFEEGDMTSKLSMNATYSKYNETPAAAVNFTGYTRVGDLRAADLLEKALDNTEKASKVQFDFTSTSTFLIYGRNDVLVSQQAHVHTQNSGGAYSFDVTGSVLDDSVSYVYQNGQMTTTVVGKDPSYYTTTDSLAKEFISTYFLDTAQFSALSCSSIDKVNGTCTFTFSSPETSVLEDELEWIEMTEDNITAKNGTLNVTISNGRITSYRYNLTLSLNEYGNSYTLTYSSVANNFVYS